MIEPGLLYGFVRFGWPSVKLDEEERRKRAKDLDPRWAHYPQIPGGGGGGAGAEIEEFQESKRPFHPEYAPETMQRRPQRSRFGGARGGGQIVEVEGGHIVRATGRKDRHSKVCTAKGTRDRRVRLSAHTAIQFYDVQDRLGYDRPSKAVDWLIKNAKEAIDELAELPAWHPTTASATAAARQDPQRGGDPGKRPMPPDAPVSSASAAAFGYGGGEGSSGAFLPPSLDSDAIADTIKSFFPITAAAAAAPSSSPRYQNYAQDLRLSLHSFQDSIFQQTHHPIPPAQHALFSSFNLAPASWPEPGQRMAHWSSPETSSSGHGAGYLFNVPALPPLGHQGQFFTQREPLQSNSPSIHGLAEPVPTFIDHMTYHTLLPSASSIGFASGGGFSGFRVPARVHDGDEEHDGISDKPSSASSTSHR